MPLETQVRAAVPDGLLRDDTMTWLIDELRSGQEETLRFVVIPVDGRRSGSTFLL